MQKLSAWNYIRNNKRRIAVLVISLGLCFMATYIANFLISSTEETFRPIVLENTKKIQYVYLASSSLGIDSHKLSEEELDAVLEEKNLEVAKKLEGRQGIKKVFYAQIIYILVAPGIGQMTVEVPCVTREEVPVIMEHFGAELSEGRLPENPGEVVIDRASLQNGKMELNGYFREKNYGDVFRVVGILDCDSYFGVGIPSKNMEYERALVTLSDGSIEDMAKELDYVGIEARENYDSIVDYKWGKKMLQEQVIDVMDVSSKAIYVGMLVLLSISLFIVYTMYLRDRHNEWCLYCSIGYSRKSIYFSIIRELLFSFGTALVMGGILILVMMGILDHEMIKPLGVRCRYFYPKAAGEIVCSYVLLLGLLQIPIRFALYRIRTVDAMEDDLY